MANKLERKLLRTARRKHMTRKQIGAYVYRTLDRIKRENSRGN